MLSFEESFEAHETDVHPYPDSAKYQFRQLIEAVWTLDDAGWREVERGLQAQAERRDVVAEDARSLAVLCDFLASGRRRIAEPGAGVPLPVFPLGKERPALAPRIPTPISKPRWGEAVHSAEVPLMFLIKGPRPAPEGSDVPPQFATPVWDADRALAALNVTEVPFDETRSAVVGYARGRMIAVSPTSPLPHVTRFHELAHVLLGHTTEHNRNDLAVTQHRNLHECEAEAVAMLCCAALGLPGVEASGRYIQQWWESGKVPKRSVQRILKAVDQIVQAGTATPAGD